MLFTNHNGKKFVTDTNGRRLIRLSLSSSSNSPSGQRLNGKFMKSFCRAYMVRESNRAKSPFSLTQGTSGKVRELGMVGRNGILML